MNWLQVKIDISFGSVPTILAIGRQQQNMKRSVLIQLHKRNCLSWWCLGKPMEMTALTSGVDL